MISPVIKINKNVSSPTLYYSTLNDHIFSTWVYIQNFLLGSSLFQENPYFSYPIFTAMIALPKDVEQYTLSVKANKIYAYQGKEYIRTNIDGIQCYFMKGPNSRSQKIYANSLTKIILEKDEIDGSSTTLYLYLGFLLTQPILTGSFDLTFDYDIQIS